MSRLQRELACRRRLGDGAGERWLWALGSSLPWVGLAVLLLHALTRRTITPFLYGLTALGALGFLVLTLGGCRTIWPAATGCRRRRSRQRSP
jgi:hypothetical protein